MASSPPAAAPRWPDRLNRDNIGVEHWGVAERQGETAARKILDWRERFNALPLFWTRSLQP